MPKLRALDPVVLLRDIPEASLRAGDLGAIVEVLGPSMYEVEFVTAAGRTQALRTIAGDDLRPVHDNDLPGVRDASPSEGAA